MTKPDTLSLQDIQDFQEVVWRHYRAERRDMPWRRDHSPYRVLVSELMLQQTQVARVIPKFEAFIHRFPDIRALAAAPLSEVLIAWSGLGYNRRAKYLHQAAATIFSDHDGKFPTTFEELMRLPGIGPNTAGAILAYAFDQPVVFIETNVRTVLLSHFFSAHDGKVGDVQLREVAEQVLDREQPREWYWALMDYGSFIKRHHGTFLTQSAAYRRQSPLRGSQREMRGMVLKRLTEGPARLEALQQAFPGDPQLEPALRALEQEGLIALNHGSVRLTGSA